MTLIVGIKCQNGIVIGSDGAATYGVAFGPDTIRQATHKLNVINDRIILGVSGPVGLGQSYALEVEEYLKGRKNNEPWDHRLVARTWFTETMWKKHTGPAYERSAVVSQARNQATGSLLSHTSILAFAIKDQAHLIQFDYQCQPEEATEGLPFVSIGIGQLIADPFLAFIRRLFWPKGLPSLSDGTFAAIWTLQHAIASHPGGVAEPIEIATLAKDDGKWRANIRFDAELDEDKQMVQNMEDEMRRILRNQFTPKEPTMIPGG